MLIVPGKSWFRVCRFPHLMKPSFIAHVAPVSTRRTESPRTSRRTDCRSRCPWCSLVNPVHIDVELFDPHVFDLQALRRALSVNHPCHSISIRIVIWTYHVHSDELVREVGWAFFSRTLHHIVYQTDVTIDSRTGQAIL